jgi:hypothetical protein
MNFSSIAVEDRRIHVPLVGRINNLVNILCSVLFIPRISI